MMGLIDIVERLILCISTEACTLSPDQFLCVHVTIKTIRAGFPTVIRQDLSLLFFHLVRLTSNNRGFVTF